MRNLNDLYFQNRYNKQGDEDNYRGTLTGKSYDPYAYSPGTLGADIPQEVNIRQPKDPYEYKPGMIGADIQPYDASTPKADKAIQGGSTAAAEKISGASLVNPIASVGGSFLINYLAAKAAEERQKRDLAMRTQADYAQNQNKGMDTLLNAWTRSLR